MQHGRLKIKIRDSFSAIHQLQLHGEPEYPHAHNWRVNALFLAPATCDPSVRGALVAMVERVVAGLAGKNLMHLPEFQDHAPSAENLAALLYRHLEQETGALKVKILQVTVEETPQCRASFISPTRKELPE